MGKRTRVDRGTKDKSLIGEEEVGMALPQMARPLCETTHELRPNHSGKSKICRNSEKWPVGMKPTPTRLSQEREGATEHADHLLRTVIERIFSHTQNSNHVYVPRSLFAHLNKIRTDSERYERFRGSVRGYNIDIMDAQDGETFPGEADNSDAKVVLHQQDNDGYVILSRQRDW
jgi:hypothetical protein